MFEFMHKHPVAAVLIVLIIVAGIHDTAIVVASIFK